MAAKQAKRFGIRDLRNDTLAVRRALDADGEVILTHYGEPFALLLPYDQASPLEDFFHWLDGIEPTDSGLADAILDERRREEAEQVDTDPWQ